MSKKALYATLLLALGVISTSCVPFPLARQPTPLPTYTAAPTYTPQPTYTPFPTDTPPPPPTYTPQPTYTPLPTYTPEPTARPAETKPPTQRPAETKAPAPTQPPAVCCSGLPPSVRGSITPLCGTPQTVFTMNIWGFDPYEQVGFWVSGPQGPIAGTRQTYSVGPTGSAEGLWFTPATFDIYDEGIYGWVFEGSATGHQAIVYFKICP